MLRGTGVTGCELPPAYHYTVGRAVPREILMRPCGGTITRVALWWSVNIEYRAGFDLCEAHRTFFIRIGRTTIRGSLGVVAGPDSMGVTVRPAPPPVLAARRFGRSAAQLLGDLEPPAR
jgi:hypothetical protein